MDLWDSVNKMVVMLNMDVDLTFYDTTTIYFKVERKDEGFRRRGY